MAAEASSTLTIDTNVIGETRGAFKYKKTLNDKKDTSSHSWDVDVIVMSLWCAPDHNVAIILHNEKKSVYPFPIDVKIVSIEFPLFGGKLVGGFGSPTYKASWKSEMGHHHTFTFKRKLPKEMIASIRNSDRSEFNVKVVIQIDKASKSEEELKA